MKSLEEFLKPTQKSLFNLIRKKYRGKTIVHQGCYILVSGEAPIMLLAHLDTVHEKPVKDICKSLDGNILMSPQGIGGDDRCGVYALVKAYEGSPVKPWLLFTCDEEIGGLGAAAFVTEYSKGKMPKGLDTLKLLIEIDRKGNKDAVYYGCDNAEFEAYITSKGFVTANGSFSDISIIAPKLGVAAVNLSSGYHNAHTLHEYINRKQIDAVVQSVIGIIADAAKPDFPRYDYIERVWDFKDFDKGYGVLDSWQTRWDDCCKFGARKVPLASKMKVMNDIVPSDLSGYLAKMYDELLDLYTTAELEWFRKEYGDPVIGQLYDAEFGPYFDTDNVQESEDGWAEIEWLREEEQ
ncbi:MAG: hypothetical protein IJQ03_01310 [Firmicutes bacterium]|nr:hypothetical protein [Bacillota bacterium]